jgi:tetratricopeptide (TPR) repeat protein
MVLFVVLFVYFFDGIGVKGITGVKRVKVPIEKRPADLILAAPPALPVLEATRSDRGSSLVEESSGTMKKSDTFILPGQQRREITTPTVRIGKTRSKGPTKAKVIVNKGEASKMPVIPDLSDEVRYRFNVALFYQEEKNFPQAKREYEKVVQMWPLYAEAHNNLGVVYKELGMLDQGINHLNRALALNPEYTRAHNNLGVIYQLKGDFAQAKKKYKKALAVDRNHLSSYNNLGLVYRAEKRFHKAREVLGFGKGLGHQPPVFSNSL